MDPVTIYLVGALVTGIVAGPALAESGYTGGYSIAQASIAAAATWPVALPAFAVLTADPDAESEWGEQ
jgi:hypothetical protein